MRTTSNTLSPGARHVPNALRAVNGRVIEDGQHGFNVQSHLARLSDEEIVDGTGNARVVYISNTAKTDS
jgi:hypothetical protein